MKRTSLLPRGGNTSNKTGTFRNVEKNVPVFEREARVKYLHSRAFCDEMCVEVSDVNRNLALRARTTYRTS